MQVSPLVAVIVGGMKSIERHVASYSSHRRSKAYPGLVESMPTDRLEHISSNCIELTGISSDRAFISESVAKIKSSTDGMPTPVTELVMTES